jgi:hypothetical protein
MDNNKKRANKWLALINISIQMGAIICFPIETTRTKPSTPKKVYYSKILMVGVALALYNVIRQVNEINKRNNFFK